MAELFTCTKCGEKVATITPIDRVCLSCANPELVMYAVVRTDLNMSRGKMAAQVGHAVGECIMKTLERDTTPDLDGVTDFITIVKWDENKGTKIILAANSEEMLNQIEIAAKRLNIIHHVVEDAGSTEIPVGTKTCIGLGPDEKFKMRSFLGHLSLLR